MSSATAEIVNTIRFAMQATKESYRPESLARREALEKLGEKLGREIAKIFTASNIADLATKLSSFWTRSGLGEMKVVQSKPLLIEVKNCYDCAGWKVSETPTSCGFKRRLMKTVFGDVLNRSVLVEEIECCRRHSPACLFSVST